MEVQEDLPGRIGHGIREMRLRADLSQGGLAQEMSRRTGRQIAQSMISLWESGRRVPGGDHLLLIVEICDGTLADFEIGEEGSKIVTMQELARRLERIEQGLPTDQRRLIDRPRQEYVTLKEAVRRSGRTRQTLYYYLHQGMLTFYRDHDRHTVLLAQEVDTLPERVR